MRTTKFKTNIDKITICCLKPEWLWQELTNNERLQKDGYELIVVDKNSSEQEESQIEKIVCAIVIEGCRLGFIKLTNSNKYCFITIDNKALWKKFTCDYKGNFSNEASLILPIIDDLTLSVNNVTSIDICLDVTSAVKSRIKKAIKNSELDLFVNCKQVTNFNERIKGVLHVFERTRERLLPNDTFYVKNQDGKAYVKVYDKAKELNESTQYKEDRTCEWDGFLPKQRLEVTVKKEHLKDYIKNRGFESHEELLHELFYDPKEQGRLFIWISHLLIYFKDKDGNVLDLVDFV